MRQSIAEKPDFRTKTILVLDDSMLMRTLLREVSRAFDFGRTHATGSIHDALRIFASGGADIAIVDWLLEGEIGVDFVRAIRHGYPDPVRRKPIIMCTAYTDLKRLRIARDAGVNEILTKPFLPERVYDALYNVLFRPRPFVVSAAFVGPDRRRAQIRIDFPDRRAAEAPPANAIELD